MDSKQRMYNALTGKDVDRLPVDIHFADHVALMRFAREYKMQAEDFYSYLENDVRHVYVMDEVEMYLQDPELMEYAYKNGFARPSETHPGRCYDQWGIEWDTQSDGQLPISGPLEQGWDGLAQMQAPDPARNGQFYVYDNAIEEFRRKNLAVDVAQYFGPFEKGYIIRGFQNFLVEMCRKKKDNIIQLLDIITEYRVVMAQEICKREVTYGHSGDDFGMQGGPLIPLKVWRELFKPRLERIWGVYKEHGLPIVHHSCGDCRIYLDDMIEIGLDAIHPVQASAMDIGELARQFGGRLTFYGGFDTADVLTTGTPEQVTQNVEHTVRTLAKSGRMIAAPINIMRNVPSDNFKALVEAVHKCRSWI